MSEGLRAEDVKEAVELWDDTIGPNESVLPVSTQIIMAAARDHLQCLASQEQTPDYEAAAKAVYESIEDLRAEERLQGGGVLGNFYWSTVLARAAVDAALVGFHPQPTESPEVPT